MNEMIPELFLDFSTGKLRGMTENVASCLHRLSDEQVWAKQGDHENAVGNLILHLCGNMRQWVIAGVGGAPDVRRRDEEFSTEGGMDGEELMGRFSVTVDETLKIIAAVPASRLVEIVHPQGRTVSVLDAIYQVVGHVQQHVGQIILLTKQMAGMDLDLTMPRPR